MLSRQDRDSRWPDPLAPGAGAPPAASDRPESGSVPHRPSQVFRAPVRSASRRAPSWGEVVSASIAVGVVSGLLELGVLFGQVRGLHYVDWTTLMITRHAGWMIPTTAAALIVPLALLLIGPMLALSAWRLRKDPAADAPGPAWDWAGMVLGFLLLYGPMLAIRGLHPAAPLALALGVGSRIRRLLVRPTAAWRRRIHGAAAIGIGVLALLVLTQRDRGAAMPAGPAAKEVRGAPNLLWIVLDTLRADRMSVYGYARPTTPELASWARAGITFEMARSTAPWTLPSHVSMFTGLWPSEHGARVDRSYHLDSPTLAEHLQSRGYNTAGIVANVRMCNTVYGVGRGFDYYVDYPWRDEVNLKAALSNSALGPVLVGLVKRLGLRPPAFYPYIYKQPATVIATKGKSWLDSACPPGSAVAGADSSRPPFFLFLNFMDVHAYYIPKNGTPLRFWTGPLPPDRDACPEAGWQAKQARDAADAEHRAEKQRELDTVTRRISDLYDECIAGLDAQVGRLLAGLRDSGQLANTWVVITADHGEHFGEHGQFGHGSSLYNEQTHVPLILIPPLGDGRDGNDPHAALRGRRIRVPVSLRDLPATMTELLLSGSSSPFPGRSLARHWRSDRPEPPDPILSQIDEPKLKGEDFRTDEITWMESLIDEDHALIEHSRQPPELYDLFGDPGQDRNLAARPEDAPRRDRMKKVLDGLHHRPEAGPTR